MIRHLFAGALSLALILGPAAAAQTPALPATPAGEAVRLWLEALNSGDPKTAAAKDPRAVVTQAESGGLDLVTVERASETEVVALMRTRLTGNYGRATWSLRGSEIADVRFQPLARPADAPAIERLDDRELGAFVRRFLERGDYSGVVLVARDGKPVISEARGLADRETGARNTADSRFRVGSMNKMFTAVAILQLVQAGRVRLDAPVGTYLKDYPNAEFARTVTVHQLLTHTGGAGDIFGPQFVAKRLELRTLKDYVSLYGARPSDGPPGGPFRYANYGYILLGRIVEEVSGQSYADYVRDRIFRPAGMTASGFEPETATVAGRTKGYMVSPEGYRSNVDTLPWSGTSAGGGYATARDMLAFATALTGHRLLDAEHTRLATTRKVDPGYAYGFDTNALDGLPSYGHSGGAPGMNGELRILGDGKVVVVALSNVSPPGRASQVLRQILQRVKLS